MGFGTCRVVEGHDVMTAYENSADTGKLFGIARVLHYDVRNVKRFEPAASVVHRSNSRRADRLDPAVLVDIMWRRDGNLITCPNRNFEPFPTHSGRRKFIAILQHTKRKERIYVHFRCSCGASGYTRLQYWAHASYDMSCKRCGYANPAMMPKAARMARQAEERATLPYREPSAKGR